MNNWLDEHIQEHEREMDYYPENTMEYAMAKCFLAFLVVLKSLEMEGIRCLIKIKKQLKK